MVQPDIAVFGKKDYQQLMVIRRMVEDLAMPVTVVGVETTRESDGLAMSSRNGYLSAEERAIAPALYRIIRAAAARLQQGEEDYASLEREAAGELEAKGLRSDYFSVRRAEDLGMPGPMEKALVILAAAYLGKARLIDNLEVSR
jgi:pantoate--beta-alanine ligase